MAYKKTAALVFALLFSFSGCFAAGAAGPKKGDIPNFYEIEEGFYRGGCPARPGGLEFLRAAGVKTVIDFRRKGRETAREKSSAEQLGMKYVNIPFRFLRLPPEDKEIRRFLDIAKEPKNRPVFMHCQHGRDRSGMMAAVYRVAAQGWGPKDALAEAERLGLRPFYLQMKYFILNKAEAFRDAKKETR